MICEMSIFLVATKLSNLYYSNHFIHQVEKVCDYRDRLRLFETFRIQFNYFAKHHQTMDSSILNPELDHYGDAINNKRFLSNSLPFF